MLLTQFDSDKNAVINPHIVSSKISGFPKTAAIFFSNDIINEIFARKTKIIGKMLNSNGEYPVFEMTFHGKKVAVAQAFVGAPSCVASIEDLIAMGVENIVVAGSCGRLIEKLGHLNLMLPVSALRDEGTSFHYAPPSDEIELDKDCVHVIAKVLEDNKIPFMVGKTWTTDGLYRETKAKVQKRIEQGAIVVDMECAAIAAMAKFRGVNYAQILYGADSLLGESYDPSLLKNIDGNKEIQLLPIVLECAVALQEFSEGKKKNRK